MQISSKKSQIKKFPKNFKKMYFLANLFIFSHHIGWKMCSRFDRIFHTFSKTPSAIEVKYRPHCQTEIWKHWSWLSVLFSTDCKIAPFHPDFGLLKIKIEITRKSPISSDFRAATPHFHRWNHWISYPLFTRLFSYQPILSSHSLSLSLWTA